MEIKRVESMEGEQLINPFFCKRTLFDVALHIALYISIL